MKDVNYKWKSDTITVEKKNIAQFDMKDVQLRSDFMSYVSGKSHHVRFHRNDLEGEMTWSEILGSCESTFPTLRRLTQKSRCARGKSLKTPGEPQKASFDGLSCKKKCYRVKSRMDENSVYNYVYQRYTDACTVCTFCSITGIMTSFMRVQISRTYKLLQLGIAE